MNINELIDQIKELPEKTLGSYKICGMEIDVFKVDSRVKFRAEGAKCILFIECISQLTNSTLVDLLWCTDISNDWLGTPPDTFKGIYKVKE